jgi:predicted transcriptional regulator
MGKKNSDKKKFEVTKEEAIKENKKLAKLRQQPSMKEIIKRDQENKKTIAERQKELVVKIQDKMKDPDLLIDTIKEIQTEVAGEDDTIIAEIIVSTTRLVNGAIAESKNFFLSDKTGIGKDHITKKTLEVIIPEEDRYHVTKMSNEAFTYWHVGESWDRKVIHFEDITQSLLNTSTFKTMASGDNYAVVVKDQKTIQIPIDGKPVMMLTSHHANPEDEALRRFPIGSCDDSIEQTKRIKDKISRKYTGRSKNNIDAVLRGAVQSLEPYPVIIPFAELIQYFFPEDMLMRTHYHRFLDYICASAVFHQYQREKTEDGNIIATPDDYMIARMVLIYTTSNPKMIPMSKEYRDILQILQQNVAPMSVMEIFQKCDQSKIWLYRHLPNLVKTGLIVKGKRHDDNANKDITTYQYLPDENPNALPTWEQIGKKIKEIDEKTDKTEKTKKENIGGNDLKKWFYQNKIILKKPKKGNGFYLVFSGMKIPFYREVLSVFSVISLYLCERDEKKYKKYYQEPELTQEVKEESKQTKIEEAEGKTEKTKNEFDDKELLVKIESIMKTKEKHEWAINDICFSLGFANLQSRKKVSELLKNTCTDPKNKTKIQMVDESGLIYRLGGDNY